jgi:hypothetical protein
LRHGPRPHRDSELVQVGLGAAGVPCWTEVVVRSRRLFRRDLVGGGQWKTAHDGNELVFGPGILVVIETLPKRSQSSLNLACVNCGTMSALGDAYL